MNSIVYGLAIVAFVAICQAQNMADNDTPWKRLVCYYKKTSASNTAPYALVPADVDPFLCSDIIYGFLNVGPQGSIASPMQTEIDHFNQLNQLKVTNPRLRTYISIGGMDTTPEAWSNLLRNPSNVVAALSQIVLFLRIYGFNGLDIAWNPINAADKFAFLDFVKNVRSRLDQESMSASKKFLLSVAISGDYQNLINSYSPKELSDVVDSFNLLSFGYKSTGKTALHSALRKPSNNQADSNNQDSAIRYLITNNVPGEKINLGIPTHGQSYQLCTTMNPDVGASACGDGTPGMFTKTPGKLTMYEICQNLNSGWLRDWSLDQLTPFAYQSNQWVSYDDADSLSYKVNFINMYGLGGAMVSDLGSDDFLGFSCNRGPYPITGTLNKMFNFPVYAGIVKVKRIQTLPGQMLPRILSLDLYNAPVVPQTTVDAGSPGFQCPSGRQMYPDLKNCSKFYYCTDGKLLNLDCPQGYLFDKEKKTCDIGEGVRC